MASIPSVMFIEMAMDSLKNQNENVLASEIRQFNSLGPERKQQIIDSVVKVNDNSLMAVGYILGLETARVMLKLMPSAVKGNVSI